VASFVGRTRELAQLGDQLDIVRRGGRTPAVSRPHPWPPTHRQEPLAEVFAERSGLPYLVFQAARSSTLRVRTPTLPRPSASSLPNASSLQAEPRSLTVRWRFSLVHYQPTTSRRVLDELRGSWRLSLAVRVSSSGCGSAALTSTCAASAAGSDLAMMEQLTKPDQPFHGRGTEIILQALTLVTSAR